MLDAISPGSIIRDTRRRHELSQERLATRVGTRQSAISRLERGEVSPTIETMELLLNAMGETLEFGPQPLERSYDPLHRKSTGERPARERLALALSGTARPAEFARRGEQRASAKDRPAVADEPVLDAGRIFRVLRDFDVVYVLIGGIAVQAHGHLRVTDYADLIPDPEPANLTRLADALNAMDARVLNPGHETDEISGSMLPRSTIWQFTTRDGDIDVMHGVPGGRVFRDLSADALRIRLDGVEVPVVGLDDLIRMKLARGRKVDLEDVAALTDD